MKSIRQKFYDVYPGLYKDIKQDYFTYPSEYLTTNILDKFKL